jgi:hypothetical protein
MFCNTRGHIVCIGCHSIWLAAKFEDEYQQRQPTHLSRQVSSHEVDASSTEGQHGVGRVVANVGSCRARRESESGVSMSSMQWMIRLYHLTHCDSGKAIFTGRSRQPKSGSLPAAGHLPAGGASVGRFHVVPSVLAAALSDVRLHVRGLLTVLVRKPSSQRCAAAYGSVSRRPVPWAGAVSSTCSRTPCSDQQ